MSSAKFRLESMSVEGLWGWRDFETAFNPDINFLIGKNGTGKSTMLHLVRHVVVGDVRQLARFDFSSVEVKLTSFDGNKTKTLGATQHENSITFRVSRKKFEFPSQYLISDRRIYRRHEIVQEELREELRGFVPVVWLPVNRRSDVGADENEAVRRRERVETIDEKLEQLLNRLQRYRLRLESQMSKRYKEFERQVLTLLLYDEEVDRFGMGELSKQVALTEEDAEQLTKSFKDADLYNSGMQKKIAAHFDRAKEAVEILASREKGKGVPIDEILLIPLIKRTKSIIEFARTLEADRDSLFEPLGMFTRIINEFITGKTIVIADDGSLEVLPPQDGARTLNASHLSSGEKQILILLTQALLNEGNPVVYIADEPELSLHVEWQSKLINAVIKLAREVQIVVATHSPDVVAEHGDKTITLEVGN